MMDILQPLGAVVLVLGLLCAALWLLRRRSGTPFTFPRGGARQIEVLERSVLGPQHSLVLIRAGRKQLLLSTSPSSCALIAEVEPQL